MSTLLGFAGVGEQVTAAVACQPNQKRCGPRCIPKNACCPRTQKRCGGRCIPKRACCLSTHKRCGSACIRMAACCSVTHKFCDAACVPKSTCCSDDDCNVEGALPNFRLCVQGQCVVGQGTCPAGGNACAGAASCGPLGPGCQCFQSKNPVRTRCGTNDILGNVCSACVSDADCAAAYPNIPGVFCGNSTGGNCSCAANSGFCMAPCAG